MRNVWSKFVLECVVWNRDLDRAYDIDWKGVKADQDGTG